MRYSIVTRRKWIAVTVLLTAGLILKHAFKADDGTIVPVFIGLGLLALAYPMLDRYVISRRR